DVVVLVPLGALQGRADLHQCTGLHELGSVALEDPGEVRCVASGELGGQRGGVVLEGDGLEGDAGDALRMRRDVLVGDLLEQGELTLVRGPDGHAELDGPVRGASPSSSAPAGGGGHSEGGGKGGTGGETAAGDHDLLL